MSDLQQCNDPAENLRGMNKTLIRGFESAKANEKVSVTRENNLLTVADSAPNQVTARAVTWLAAALAHDGPQALAALLRAETVMPLRWIAVPLPMNAPGYGNLQFHWPRKGICQYH